jgi:predicted small lipoprotein YifL
VLFAAVLLLPLGLAACGVKGPLDPPPGAGVVETPSPQPAGPPRTSAAPQSDILVVTGPQATPPSRPVSGAAVENAPAARQRSALDWLID